MRGNVNSNEKPRVPNQRGPKSKYLKDLEIGDKKRMFKGQRDDLFFKVIIRDFRRFW